MWPPFQRRHRERELDEEIQAHLAMAIRDRIERGESPEQAALAVRREFGNRALIRETTRRMWRWSSLHGVWQDARYALRGMRRSPGFTAVAVISLALGIGANTAIFSLLEAAMLRLLPVSHPEELVELLQKYPGEPRGNGYWSRRSYEHIRDGNHVFSALIAASVDNAAPLELQGAQPETGIVEDVSGNYFPDLGIQPAVGRLIGPEDNPADPNGAVAVLSWEMWTSRFHQDPAVLGRRILVENAPATIVGVAPRGFVGLRVEAKTDIWLPQPPTQNDLTLLARLRPGATLQQARAEMTVLYRFTIEERAAASRDPQVRQLSVQVEPAGDGLNTVRDRFGKPLTVLMTIVGLLLLLACVNIASLLLSRAAGRKREMALRTSLGASRGRLLRQMLTESLLLSIVATLFGIVLAYFGTAALLRIMASGRLHERVYLRVEPDLHVLLFTAVIAVLAGLLFGIAPAWNAFRTAPVNALRQSGRAFETRASRVFAQSLVAAQVALSMLLLTTGALFIANLASLERADLGFHRDHVLLVGLDPSRSGYDRQRLSRAYEELLDRIGRIPGVRSASLSAPTPLSGAGASGLVTAEGLEERPEDLRWTEIAYIAPRYFETLGIPLLAGRGFSHEDQFYAGVAVISESVARYYFAGRNPIGRHVTFNHLTGVREARTYEIVGVVGDANYLDIREPMRRTVYVPAFYQGGVEARAFLIRIAIHPQAVVADVRREVGAVAPGVFVSQITTLNEQIDASIVPERLIATLSGFFGALAAVLAGIGLYGLLAYAVARRTNEIGVRVALGATTRNVISLVLRDMLATVGAGLALGIPLAAWGRGLAAALIPNLPAQTMGPLALAAAGTVIVALLAAWMPALRAARVDPMEALREE